MSDQILVSVIIIDSFIFLDLIELQQQSVLVFPAALVVFHLSGLVLDYSTYCMCVYMCLLERRYDHLLWKCSQCDTSIKH